MTSSFLCLYFPVSEIMKHSNFLLENVYPISFPSAHYTDLGGGLTDSLCLICPVRLYVS